MNDITKPRIELVAVHVFGSCFPEHWHESESPPPGYQAIATVVVDGIRHYLDYGLSVNQRLDLVIRDSWADDEIVMSQEERAMLLKKVSDMVEVAWESGDVGGPISEEDWAPRDRRYVAEVPAFIRNRLESEAAKAGAVP